MSNLSDVWLLNMRWHFKIKSEIHKLNNDPKHIINFQAWASDTVNTVFFHQNIKPMLSVVIVWKKNMPRPLGMDETGISHQWLVMEHWSYYWFCLLLVTQTMIILVNIYPSCWLCRQEIHLISKPTFAHETPQLLFYLWLQGWYTC